VFVYLISAASERPLTHFQEAVAVAAFCKYVIERTIAVHRMTQHSVLGLALGPKALTWSLKAEGYRYAVHKAAKKKDIEDVNQLMQKWVRDNRSGSFPLWALLTMPSLRMTGMCASWPCTCLFVRLQDLVRKRGRCTTYQHWSA